MGISVYSISKNSKLLGLAAGFAIFVLAVTVLLWYVAQGVGAAEDLAGSSDPNERKQAVERLRGKKGGAARRVLSALSKDTDKWVAIRAVRTLSENRSPDSRDLLQKIVQDQSYNPSARGEAAAELCALLAFSAGAGRGLVFSPWPEKPADVALALRLGANPLP